MKVAIIGGGAAGIFAAISAKTHQPEAVVEVFEKSDRLLGKVKISGGGRCNVTHHCDRISEMVKNYPRGDKFLKKVFGQFFTKDTIAFYESRGVSLKVESDGRMFPVTDNSQSIIDCLLQEAQRLKVKIQMNQRIKSMAVENEKVKLSFPNRTETFDKVIVATGGSPNKKGLEWLESLGLSIVNPVPSLFTFNLPKDPIRDLMGLAVENAFVKIQGTKWKAEGPLLITHWGMSGPAVLRLSAFAAEWLSQEGYNYQVVVNWLNEPNEEIVRTTLNSWKTEHPKKKIINLGFDGIPNRLWTFLLVKSGIDTEQNIIDIPKKDINRLINHLTNDVYEAKGKTTFKEEFVTCGGVDLSEVNSKSMQSKKYPQLYFAGEVLNIDGVTGGFNFQAAWSTGFVAGKLLD